MRFSLRWLLAAIAYVALATAAISTKNALLTDLVWVASAAAFVYAGIVAFTAKGRPQAVAFGFLLAAALFVAGMYLSPERVSLYSFVGYTVAENGAVYQRVDDHYQVAPVNPRAMNAAGTLVAGLWGCFLGALASQRWNCESAED